MSKWKRALLAILLMGAMLSTYLFSHNLFNGLYLMALGLGAGGYFWLSSTMREMRERSRARRWFMTAGAAMLVLIGVAKVVTVFS